MTCLASTGLISLAPPMPRRASRRQCLSRRGAECSPREGTRKTQRLAPGNLEVLRTNQMVVVTVAEVDWPCTSGHAVMMPVSSAGPLSVFAFCAGPRALGPCGTAGRTHGHLGNKEILTVGRRLLRV